MTEGEFHRQPTRAQENSVTEKYSPLHDIHVAAGAAFTLLSLALCYAGYILFRDRSGGTFAGVIFFRPEHLLLIVLFGVLLGLAGSLVSVGRHLRHV